MKLGDYFGGIRLSLTSPYPPDEVAWRINDGAASVFMPFATGVVGWARFGHLRLRYQAGLFRHDAKPILAGRIVPDRAGARLDLIYRAPVPTYFAVTIWYLAYALFLLTILLGHWLPGVGLPEKLGVGLAMLGFGLAPLVLYFLATHSAAVELDRLMDFLCETLDARAPEPGWPKE